MAQIDDNYIICPVCLEVFSDPVGCEKCSNIFCKKCVEPLRECPMCKARPLVYKPNAYARRLVSGIHFTCPNKCGQVFNTEQERDEHARLCGFALFQCSFCDKLEKTEDLFWMHLRDVHKKEIIQKNNKKDKNYNHNPPVQPPPVKEPVPVNNINNHNDLQGQPNNNFVGKKKNYDDSNVNLRNQIPNMMEPQNSGGGFLSRAKTMNTFSNQNNINDDLPSLDVVEKQSLLQVNTMSNQPKPQNINYYPSYDLMNNQNKKMTQVYGSNSLNNQGGMNPMNFSNPFQASKPRINIPPGLFQGSNTLYYCHKPTLLNCGCCSGICCEGQCLCPSCMNINCKAKGLKAGQLINKIGRVATLFGGNFVCGDRFINRYKNVYGIEFTKNVVCGEGGAICLNCVPLKKFMNIYLKASSK